MGQSTLTVARRTKALTLAGSLATAWPANEPPSEQSASEPPCEPVEDSRLRPCATCGHKTFNPEKCGGCLRRERGKRQQRNTGLFVLYRHYDARDRLLYVGQTIDPSARWRQHRLRSDWSSDIAYTKYEYFDSKAELNQAEDRAIKQESPLWNVALTEQSHAVVTHSE